MSILIKGMEIPSCCMFCPVSNSIGCGLTNPPFCMTTKEMLADRPDWCPLVELPPHGNLIDRDALVKQLGITDMDCFKCAWGNHGFCGRSGDFNNACEAIEDAPTIIEAEGEKYDK